MFIIKDIIIQEVNPKVLSIGHTTDILIFGQNFYSIDQQTSSITNQVTCLYEPSYELSKVNMLDSISYTTTN